MSLNNGGGGAQLNGTDTTRAAAQAYYDFLSHAGLIMAYFDVKQMLPCVDLV